MTAFFSLLRANANYRRLWTGQLVSEVGDHFNNIAVFSLAMELTRSGWVVASIMLARAVPILVAGPLAGVVLDRFDRRRIMVASDLVRAVVALGFIAALSTRQVWILYVCSALLSLASPFFTSGRGAILPAIATPSQLHTANALTQTTNWTSTAVGAFLAGATIARFGYEWAFVLNAASFLISAWAIVRMRVAPGTFRALRHDESEVQPWREYVDGWRYLRSHALVLAIALVGVGWATGGGASQVLFTLFAEVVFGRGADGIGTIWGCAGLGLIAGGVVGHWLGPRLSYRAYKNAIAVAYLVHGGAYVAFSQVPTFGGALALIALSRAGVAVSSVLNATQVLTHVEDAYRGRVLATMETMLWTVMLLSTGAAGIASEHVSPRVIGAWAGVFSASTAVFWSWANWTGRLPEPRRVADPAREEAMR